MSCSFTRTLFNGVALSVACLFHSATLAAPQGGQIQSGSGSIQNGISTTTINQSSSHLVVDWNSFNIAANESVNFIQPNATAAALNRIFDQNPSQIFGNLNANGMVFLINNNGFLFGESARVKVGGLVTSNLIMDAGQFMNGMYQLHSDGNGNGMIINRGLISASTGGVSLVSDTGVVNEGRIYAAYGNINLAATSSATLDFDGDGLLRLAVGGEVIDNAEPFEPVVGNSGEIVTDGGEVLLTGTVARDVFSNVVNNDGVIRATGISNEGGVIKLIANGGDTFISGSLDASSDTGNGGKIQVLGDRVAVIGNSDIDASGKTGGGEVLIGGDYQGKNPGIKNASHTYVGDKATIAADALERGDGGKVIVWADDSTRHYGNISVRADNNTGGGGFVEVSGKNHLHFDGMVDTTASNGNHGTLLLDPQDITILDDAGGTDDIEIGDSTIIFIDPVPSGSTTDFTISEATLEALTGNVILQAQRNIIIDILTTDGVLDFINQTGGESVVFQAGRHITFNDTSNILQTAGADIHLEADSFHSTSGAANGTGVLTLGAINSNGGDIRLFSSGIFGINSTITAGTGNISLARSDNSSIDLDAHITQAGYNLISTMGVLTIGSAATAGSDGAGTGSINRIASDLDLSASINIATSTASSLNLHAAGGTPTIDIGNTLTVDQPLLINADIDGVQGGLLTISGDINAGTNSVDLIAADIRGDNTSASVEISTSGNVLLEADAIGVGGGTSAIRLDNTSDLTVNHTGGGQVEINLPGGATNDIDVSNSDVLSTENISSSTSGLTGFTYNNTSGNSIGIATVNATGVDVSLQSMGGFTDSSSNISANDLSLIASSAGASVGLTGTGDIDIDITGSLSAATVDGGIYVDDTAGALQLTTINSGADLEITANGAITQTNLNSTDRISAQGTSSFIAGSNSIVLDDLNNDFTGAIDISNSGNNAVTLADSNDIDLGTISTGSGTFMVTATSGSISDSGTQTVAGDAIFNAGDAGNIILDDGGNSYSGTVDFNSAGTLNNLTFVDDTAIDLQTTIVNGILDITADGSITQSGAIMVGGTTDLDAGSGGINLSNGENDFQGAVNLTASGNVEITDQNTLELVSVVAPAADLTIIAQSLVVPFITTQVNGLAVTLSGTSDINVTNTGALEIIAGGVNNHDGAISISADNSIIITGDITENNNNADAADTINIITTASTGHILGNGGAVSTGAILTMNADGGIGVGSDDTNSVDMSANMFNLTTNGTNQNGDVKVNITGNMLTSDMTTGINLIGSGTHTLDLGANSWTNDDAFGLVGTNNIILRATGGNITNNGIGSLSAIDISLFASATDASIGSLTTPMQLFTTGSVTATANNGVGGIFLNMNTSMNIAASGIDAGAGGDVNVNVSAIGGGITSSGTITGNNLLLIADGGIDTNTDANNLTVTSNAAGDIVLSNDGTVIITGAGISNLSGAVNLSTTNNGDILNGGGDITALTTITLDADGGIGTDGIAVNVSSPAAISLSSNGNDGAGNIYVNTAGVFERLSSAINFSTSGTGTQLVELTADAWRIDMDIGNSTDNLILNASLGDINGSNNGSMIIADSLGLTAGGFIADSTADPPADPPTQRFHLLTDANSLSARSDFSLILLENAGSVSIANMTDSQGGAISGITADNEVSVYSTGDITIGSNIISTNTGVAVTAAGPGADIIGGAGVISAGNNFAGAATGNDRLVLTAGGGIGVGTAVSTAGAGMITLDTSGSGNTGDIDVIHSGNLSTTNVIVTTAADTQAIALTTNSWDVNNAFTTSNDNLSLTSTVGGISGTGSLTATGRTVALTSALGIGLPSDPLDLTAANVVLVSNGNNVNGNIFVASTSDLDLSIAANGAGAQIIELIANSWTIGNPTNLAGDSFTLEALTGDISLTDVLTGNSIELIANGNIDASAGTITANILSTNTAGTTDLSNAANDVAAFTASNTGSGSIVLVDSGTLTLQSISTNGDVSVSTTGDISQVDDINTGTGDITVTSSGGSLMMNDGTSSTTTGGTITYTASSGDIALSSLDASSGTGANIGTINVNTNGKVDSTSLVDASVRANTVNIDALSIGTNEVNAFLLSSDIAGTVTLRYVGNAFISAAPNFNVDLDIVDLGSGLVDSSAARSAGNQRGESSGLEDVGFIDAALFSDINLFVVDGVGIALPADQSDIPPGRFRPQQRDEDDEVKTDLDVSLNLH